MKWQDDNVDTIAELQRNYKKLFYLAWSYMKNQEDAADILQDVVVNVIESKPRFANGNACMAYLRKTIRNLSINKCKKQWYGIAIEDKGLDNLREKQDEKADPYERTEVKILLGNFLSGYSEDTQDAFIRYILDEAPIKQLAVEKGFKYDSLRKQMARMQQAMSVKFKEINDKEIFYYLR